MSIKSTLALGCLVAATVATDSAEAARKRGAKTEAADTGAKGVPFPKGWRDWKHVKSLVIYSEKNPLFDSFGGFHHVYANDKALKALKGKRDFANGSALVFDLKENTDANGAHSEGKRKFVAAMVRDAKKYVATEGWGFQAWEGGDPNKPVLQDLNDQRVCATCHKQNTKDMVFSEYVN